MSIVPAALRAQLRAAIGPQRTGRVTRLVGLRVEVEGVDAAVGDAVRIWSGSVPLDAQVVAVDGKSLACMPFGELTGLRYGDPVQALGGPLSEEVGIHATAPHPLHRDPVNRQLSLGVRALDTLVPCGRGQRLGIFAGSGVGKSSLLSMITRGTDATVTVLALVGERGREVNEFLHNDLGPSGLARSVVVVATSDEPPMVRIQAAFTATRIAEWFRDQGHDVVLMMDSLTRFAMAQREVGLSAGEPPATRGYPPSVFTLLPRLLERAGTTDVGSITGLYTVLVEGDDMNEPIADAVRSILDGHIVLSRRLATAGHYPSIEILDSVSRVEPAITTPAQRSWTRELRRLLAAYREAKDLIEIGAYVAGANPLVDRAVSLREPIEGFLCQDVTTTLAATQSWSELEALIAAPAALVGATA